MAESDLRVLERESLVEDNLRAAQKRIIDFEQTMQEAYTTVNALERDNSDLQTLLAEKDATISSFEAEILILKAEKDELLNWKDQIQNELSALRLKETEHDSVKMKYEHKEHELRLDIKDLETSKLKLNEALSVLQEKHDSILNSYHQLQSTHNDIKWEYDNLLDREEDMKIKAQRDKNEITRLQELMTQLLVLDPAERSNLAIEKKVEMIHGNVASKDESVISNLQVSLNFMIGICSF